MSTTMSTLDAKQIVLRLSELGAICFGEFVLKSGIKSPIYVDLRIAIGQPDLLMSIATNVWKVAIGANVRTDVVCGVPTGAIPLATVSPMDDEIYGTTPTTDCTRQTKDYGRKRAVEGHFNDGHKCIVIEDVFVSGQSTMETAEVLRDAGLEVTDAIVFLDREQGGTSILSKEGIRVHSVVTMSELLKILRDANKIDDNITRRCQDFLKTNQLTSLPRHLKSATKPKKLSYTDRAKLCKHPMAQRLFNIMATKRTNLSLSADVTTCDELLRLANLLGPYLCILKTHMDILKDFSLDKMRELVDVANKHSFLIFEDRKFADIGNTVRLQYEGGSYEVVEWSHLINAHSLPGPGIVEGLKKVGLSKDRACVLVAEMSSVDHLCTPQYVQKTIEMANRNKDFIIGFICQSYLTSDPEMIHMVPGVKLERGNDGLGQGYMTPIEAFAKGADLIIVGRGILNAQDPLEMARRYSEASYEAYLDMTK